MHTIEGNIPSGESTDIQPIDLMKSWFRVLPEPVFPPSSYHDVMDAFSKFVLWIQAVISNSFFVELEILDKRLLSIHGVVQDLPQANFDFLRRVSEHLDNTYVNVLFIS